MELHKLSFYHISVRRKMWENSFCELGCGADCCSGHELVFGTVRTNDIFSIGDEAFAGHGSLAHCANKTLRMPMPAFKRNETSPTGSGNGFAAGCTPFGKQLTEAIGAEKFVGNKKFILYFS